MDLMMAVLGFLKIRLRAHYGYNDLILCSITQYTCVQPDVHIFVLQIEGYPLIFHSY